MACVGDKVISPTMPNLVSANVALPTYALLDTGANCATVMDNLCLKLNTLFEILNIALRIFELCTVGLLWRSLSRHGTIGSDFCVGKGRHEKLKKTLKQDSSLGTNFLE